MWPRACGGPVLLSMSDAFSMSPIGKVSSLAFEHCRSTPRTDRHDRPVGSDYYMEYGSERAPDIDAKTAEQIIRILSAAEFSVWAQPGPLGRAKIRRAPEGARRASRTRTLVSTQGRHPTR
jgi:hypothetical protein